MDKKIEETREFLQTMGMPKAQQVDICCYMILTIAGVKPEISWSEATIEWSRIHYIIQYFNTFYGMSYAENSREIINGESFLFSTGKYNKLQKAIIEEFASNSECIYVGDTIEKDLVKDVEKLK